MAYFVLVHGESSARFPKNLAYMSELLNSMDPADDETINVPDFVAEYFEDLPLMAARTHMRRSDLAAKPRARIMAHMCVMCVPSLEQLHVACAPLREQLREACRVLKVVQFLDIEPCVCMLFCFICNMVYMAPTVDDLVAMLFEPGEFEALDVKEQRDIYESLMVM